MDPLSPLLDRDGLPKDERLLIKITAGIWTGDQALLAECFRRGKIMGMPRSHVEEALLQAVLFCGFPRVVTTFGTLQGEWVADPAPRAGGLPKAEQRRAGEKLFRTIYGSNADKVEQMLVSHHGELHDFIFEAAYGRILTRPGLEPRVRELLAVGVLALTDQVPQMVAHARGAISFGASLESVRETIFTAIEVEATSEDLVRRIERTAQ
jgi:alkylhydroperoxidase/carboxymuconolactone decarboxylase family protein YurZ